jgi:hypothetical protein
MFGSTYFWGFTAKLRFMTNLYTNITNDNILRYEGYERSYCEYDHGCYYGVFQGQMS